MTASHMGGLVLLKGFKQMTNPTRTRPNNHAGKWFADDRNLVTPRPTVTDTETLDMLTLPGVDINSIVAWASRSIEEL